jgi:hypothetical protein
MCRLAKDLTYPTNPFVWLGKLAFVFKYSIKQKATSKTWFEVIYYLQLFEAPNKAVWSLSLE